MQEYGRPFGEITLVRAGMRVRRLRAPRAIERERLILERRFRRGLRRRIPVAVDVLRRTA